MKTAPQPGELVIRRARPADAAAITAMTIRAKRSNGYDEAFMAACSDELTVHPADIDAHEYWVAETDGVCGAISLHADADGREGEIHSFFIDPEWQRQGLGRRLWAKIQERAWARGLMRLHLDSDPVAVPFYEAIGFQVTGETPSGSIPGRTIPHMTMALNGA